MKKEKKYCKSSENGGVEGEIPKVSQIRLKWEWKDFLEKEI